MTIPTQTLEEMAETNEKAKKQAKTYPKKRLAFDALFSKHKAFVGIAGLRGVGKTTALKQKLRHSEQAFYVSLDSYQNLDLFELAQTLQERYGIKTLLLDEISYCKNWQQHLKKIYDRLELAVTFTSSVAVDVVKARADLSRRVIIKKMHPFSFREFLYFYKDKKMEKVAPSKINDIKTLQQISRMDYLFKEYISGGLIPAWLEESDSSIFSNILERIIERDLVYSLNFNGKDILSVKVLLEYIANAGIDDVSYSSISRNVGITKYRAIRYVDALEKAFVLNVVKPTGSSVTKEPKILFVPPFRLSYLKTGDLMDYIGLFREEFFVESMKMEDADIHYLKGKRGEKTPDYLVRLAGKKYVFEIGGPTKTRSQLKHTTEKNRFILCYPSNTKNPYRPLLFAGFL